MDYLNPHETKRKRSIIYAHLLEQDSSPVVKSGQALKTTSAFIDKDGKVLDCGPGLGSFLEQLNQNGFRNLYAIMPWILTTIFPSERSRN